MKPEINRQAPEFLLLGSTDYLSAEQAKEFERRQLTMMIEGGEYDIRKTLRYIRLHFNGLSYERIYSLYRHVERTRERVGMMKEELERVDSFRPVD